jgi:flavin reductase (DIM6/NTAB) family NADH-FMN oxidoreductase RutF
MPRRTLKPSAALYPMPVVLVTCGDMERPNIITIAWTGIACSDPPTVSISIRPNRYSHELIQRSGEFVINIPTLELLEKVDFCGVTSGRDRDKFGECGFTALPATKVKPPLIGECPINLECTVTQILPIGAHDMFLARIEVVHGESDVIDEKGRIDASRAVPITFVTYNYYRLGDYLNSYGFTGGRLSE